MKSRQKETIGYSYRFNYFGKDLYKGKTITGATINIVIRALENEKSINLGNEITCGNDKYLSDIYTISFHEVKLYAVDKNVCIDNLFRLVFGWDQIDYEIVGFGLDYLVSSNTLCYSTEMQVSKKEFETFIRSHIQDFDILDNQNAQVTSYFIHKD